MKDKLYMDEFMGKKINNEPWKNYFKLADREHNMVDHKRPIMHEKAPY